MDTKVKQKESRRTDVSVQPNENITLFAYLKSASEYGGPDRFRTMVGRKLGLVEPSTVKGWVFTLSTLEGLIG